MSDKRKSPVVDTHPLVQRYFDAWDAGELPRLAIAGSGGKGKTHLYESSKRKLTVFRRFGRDGACSVFGPNGEKLGDILWKR